MYSPIWSLEAIHVFLQLKQLFALENIIFGSTVELTISI